MISVILASPCSAYIDPLSGDWQMLTHSFWMKTQPRCTAHRVRRITERCCALRISRFAPDLPLKRRIVFTAGGNVALTTLPVTQSRLTSPEKGDVLILTNTGDGHAALLHHAHRFTDSLVLLLVLACS